MSVSTIMTCAILVEAVTEYLGGAMPERFQSVLPKQALAVLVGVVICMAARVDVFLLLDIPMAVPGLGAACTGILVSRGSNYLHDLWGRFKKQG